MSKRIDQPPIDRESRPSERHTLGPGLACAAIGLALVLVGFGRMTAVETVDGDGAREAEINRAIAHGGVIRIQAPPPGNIQSGSDEPPWIQLGQAAPPPAKSSTTIKPGLKIDVRAKAACPT